MLQDVYTPINKFQPSVHHMDYTSLFRYLALRQINWLPGQSSRCTVKCLRSKCNEGCHWCIYVTVVTCADTLTFSLCIYSDELLHSDICHLLISGVGVNFASDIFCKSDGCHCMSLKWYVTVCFLGLFVNGRYHTACRYSGPNALTFCFCTFFEDMLLLS